MSKSTASRFSCLICGKQFKGKYQLTRHEKIHSGVKPFECDICGKRSIRRSHHNQHLLTHTVKDKPWLCNIDNFLAKYKTREDLSIHKRAVHDLENSARHECVFCQRKFLIKRDLASHILKHIQERPYLCKFCHMDFQFIEGFRRHLKFQHQLHLQNKYSCQACPKEFKRKDSLAKHFRAVHTKTEKKHECKSCQKYFRFPQELKKHENTHTKPYSCRECGKSFASKDSFRDHTFQHAFPGKNYECDICSSRFNLKKSLIKHKKSVHDPKFSKRFQCIFCYRGFPRHHYLVEHLHRHTQERPHFCKLCPQVFRWKASLRYHLTTHRSNRRKAFQCELCPKQYFGHGRLLSHLHSHTGEKTVACDLCSKRFVTLEYLKVHMKIHTKRAPFPCELCGKGIMTKDALQRHMRLHTGERPIKCRHCEQSFTDPTCRHQHEHREHPHLIN